MTTPFPVDSAAVTVCEVIRRWAEIQPKAPAIIPDGGAILTFTALAAAMDGVGAVLNASGLGRGDRIAVVHSGGPELASLIFGIMDHATLVPLDPNLTSAEYTAHFQARRVDALVAETDIVPAAVQAATQLGLPVLRALPGRDHTGSPEITAGIAKHPVRPGRSRPGDTAMVLGTAGTTNGRGKVVPFSHTRLLVKAEARRKVCAMDRHDVGMVVRPLYYSAGIDNMLGTLYGGGAMVVLPRFEPEPFFRCLAAHGVTWYSGGPALHKAIHAYATKYPDILRMTRVRFFRVSSGYLEPEIIDDLERMFGAFAQISYSSSETGRIALNHGTLAPRKAGALGMAMDRMGFPFATNEVRIRGEDGSFLPDGEPGEIVVRGEEVFDGYEDNPEANAEAFADGWFRTGDEGFIAPDGYLTLTGRINEIINRGGEKVHPAEVDAAILKHPDAYEAATFPIPHPTLGEEVAAAVVQAPGARLTDQVLTRFLLKRLTGYKVQRRFYFVDAIPKGGDRQGPALPAGESARPPGRAHRRGSGERPGTRSLTTGSTAAGHLGRCPARAPGRA